MTKILSIIPTNSLKGGGEKSFFELLCFTQSRGYNNYVVVPKDSETTFLKKLEENKIKPILGEYRAFGLNGDNPLSQLVDTFRIAKIIREIKPNIVMTNLYVEASMWAAALCNTPHVYFDRGLLGLMDNKGDLPSAKPEFIQYSNAIVCNSKNGQRILKEKYDTESELVYSYVKKPKVRFSKDKTRKIIMPANFFREKNHFDILSAFVKIKQTNPGFDTKLVLMGSIVSAGNDSYYHDILDYIKKHDIEDIVEVLDYQENPWNYFSQDDIYVNLGEGEAVGRATIEAELLGVTALITNIPGHWEHKALLGNQFTFEVHNTDDLAEKITYLLNESNIKKIRDHNSRVKQKVIKWMTPNNTMDNMITIIKTISGQDNPANLIVYEKITDIIHKNKLRYEHEIAVSVQKINNIHNVNNMELELLYKPGVKLATLKLAGAIKRRVLHTFRRSKRMDTS